MKITLSVSCEAMDVVRVSAILRACGLAGTATATHSSVRTAEGWECEPGARIDLYDVSKDDVCLHLWGCLKRVYPALECAHVHESGRGFNGCIHDWILPGQCPKRRPPVL